MTWTNWAGDESCAPARVVAPTTVDELAHAVRVTAEAGRNVRVAGAGHSFGDLVLTGGTLVSLAKMSGLLSLDEEAGTVTVCAGTSLHQLNADLAVLGLALPNLGDIDVQSVGGAVSTGTHGTGIGLGNLATQVVGLDLMTANGNVIRCGTGDPELLGAARISLGALGIVVSYTLKVVPAFTLRGVDTPLPLDRTLDELDGLVDDNDHFEFFVFPHAETALTRTNNRTDEPARPRGRAKAWLQDIALTNYGLSAICRSGRRMPALIPALNRLSTRAAGSSTRVDRSHAIFASPRLVKFTESEWCLPRAACVDALREIMAMIPRRGFAVNFPIEVRFVAGDTDSLLSPAFGRDSCYLAVHMYRGMRWEPYFRAVQEIALAHDGRPHWGKRHLMGAAGLAPRYPAWDQFQAVRARLDPLGVFTNAHVARVLGTAAG